MAKARSVVFVAVGVLGILLSSLAQAKPKPKPPIERSTGCVTLTSVDKPRIELGTHGGSYPPLGPDNSFTIPATDICAHISLLYLPPNFKLIPAPGITTIQWQVDKIQFGPGATFDLSAPQIKLPKPPKPPAEGQADYCRTGDRGASGGYGKDGGEAVNLVITGLQTITNSSGGLWIRNDGGPGQDSGDSGDGQQGGGHKGSWPSECERHPGGPPGYVAPPGHGGKISVVSITGYPNLTELSKKPVKVVKLPAASGICGPSLRPVGASSNTQTIVVLGQPGCAGTPGTPGRPGA